MAQSRERLLSELRRRGARGGIIGPHRAMVKGRLTPWRLTSMVFVPLLLAGGVAVALPAVADAWAWIISQLQAPLALAGGLARDPTPLPGGLELAIPYLTTVARLPVAQDFWVVGAFCAAAIGISMLLPQRFLPVAYLLRFAVLIQLTGFLNFVIRPDRFPYDLPRYTLSLFHIGAAVLVLVPLVLGFTYFPFNIALWRKVLLAALCVVHLAVLVPLQVLVHAFIIARLSLLVMPAMFFLWGILPLLFSFIALYAWAMSWPDVTPRVATASGRS